MSGTSTTAGPDEPEILARWGIDASCLLGAGGECRVFALGADRVVRVFAPSDTPADDRGVAALVATWTDADIGLEIPRQLSAGVVGRQRYSVEVRLRGHDLDRWLRTNPSADARRAALISYLDASFRLRQLPLPPHGYGPLFPARPAGDALVFGSLAELYAHLIAVGTRESWDALAALVPDLAGCRDRLLDALAGRHVAPAFVHNDLCPANVMVSDTQQGPRVSGVLDISVHAVAADPVLDVAGAVAFVELSGHATAREDSRMLTALAADRLGDDAWLLTPYRQLCAFYYAMDAALLPWCARQLSESPFPRGADIDGTRCASAERSARL